MNKGYIYSIDDATPLEYAIQLEKLDIVQLLLTNEKIDINGQQHISFPLLHAIKQNNIDILKALLSHKDIDINLSRHKYRGLYMDSKPRGIFKSLPIVYAIDNKNTKAIKILLDHKDIDVYIYHNVV